MTDTKWNKREFKILVDAIIPDCHCVESDLLIDWLIENKDRIPTKEKEMKNKLGFVIVAVLLFQIAFGALALVCISKIPARTAEKIKSGELK